MLRTLFVTLFITLSACVTIPEDLTAVEGFELSRYLGKWYEIARLDHSFERGLTDIIAEYSMREDGGIKVINSGYNAENGQREKAEGKAYFTGSTDLGRLKVSFFGPFYGGYNIIALDKKNYSYAVVAGPNRDYFWILSRTPSLPRQKLQLLIEFAKQAGFATDKLIFVEHQD